MKISFLIFCLCIIYNLGAFSQAAVNDSCAGAVLIPSLPYTTNQNTRAPFASPNATDPTMPCAQGGGGNSVWYKFTADSTEWVTFSTNGSTPADYDVACGLYTGTCGSFTEVACDDDIAQGTNRAAEIIYQVQAGTTYYLQVAEWNGGGPSGGVPTGGDLLLNVFYSAPPPYVPLVKGPKAGSVALGAIVSTNSFSLIPKRGEEPPVVNRIAAENEEEELIKLVKPFVEPKGPEGSNYKEDNSASLSSLPPVTYRPTVLKHFQGNVSTGFIPPDPNMAVGPNHVLGMVNSSFRIWDKEGNLLKDISLNSWFNTVKNPVGFSDPQVFYDHFANRWVMIGGGFDVPYTLLISVSDDDNPLGTWYNWSLPATLGDSVTGNLPDYPQAGFDEQAYYITSNDFNPGFRYSQLRIIPKAQLLNNDAGSVTWFDMWDFRDVYERDAVIRGIVPSLTYGTPGVHFMLSPSPFSPGTYFGLWTVSDVLTNPTVTSNVVPVVQYSAAPNASQLGGTDTLIEAGGSSFHHKAVYRDSSLWIAHSIASGTGNAYSAVHYVRINPFTATNLEDYALGAEGYWHYYPALMVDAEKNAIITFSRSGNSEYIGAYVAGHKEGQSELTSSVPVKTGTAHYEQTFGNGRNRWGDYMGIGLDPADSLAIWVNTEYTSATDSWGTWIGKVKMGPLPGAYILSEPTSLNFPIREVGTTGDTLSFVITNSGLDTLVIPNIIEPDSDFVLVNPPSFPISIASFEQETLHVVFKPQSVGSPLQRVLTIQSNDSGNPEVVINLSGNSFHIIPVGGGTMYAGTGSINAGKFYTVNNSNGNMALVGSSGYQQIFNLRVHPVSHEMIGMIPSGSTSAFARINSESGDAHPIATIALPTLKGMELTDNGDSAYVGRVNGNLYKISTATGGFRLIGNSGLFIAGLATSPINGQLWASIRPVSGVLDRIYKINKNTGAATLVGSTGLGQQVLDLAFDESGNLYGLSGSGSQINSLILIDTVTGEGSIVGSMGMTNVQAICTSEGVVLQTATLRLKPDWNMVSVPINVSDFHPNAVFQSLISGAFSYQAGYRSQSILENGKGYWMKFSAAQNHIISGENIAIDTFDVNKYWNMIGMLSYSGPTSTVFPVPPVNIVSSYYWFDPDSGYIVASELEPGKGYWVKTDTGGQIIINAMFSSKNGATENDASMIKKFNSVTITDAKNHSQVLYIGERPSSSFNPDRFEMPPPPPSGVFDARFTSQRILSAHGKNIKEKEEFPIQLESAVYPLTVTWDIQENPRYKYSFVSDNENASSLNQQMKGHGSVVLQNENDMSLRLQVEENTLPTEFALTQNYPNPFNPSTVINFQLPVASNVSLKVFNVLGQEVTTLTNSMYEAGTYNVTFNAGNLASGVYFYSLRAEPIQKSSGRSSYSSVQKMMLVR